MALLLHITIALASIASASFVFVSPSKGRLRVAYGLVALTLLSGFYLVASSPTHILQTCVTGLFYLGAVSVGIITAHHKLAAVTSTKHKDR